MLNQALSLLKPYTELIKSDETGEEIAATLENILETANDDLADFLYDEWDAVLAAL